MLQPNVEECREPSGLIAFYAAAHLLRCVQRNRLCAIGTTNALKNGSIPKYGLTQGRCDVVLASKIHRRIEIQLVDKIVLRFTECIATRTRVFSFECRFKTREAIHGIRAVHLSEGRQELCEPVARNVRRVGGDKLQEVVRARTKPCASSSDATTIMKIFRVAVLKCCGVVLECGRDLGSSKLARRVTQVTTRRR